MGGLASAVVVLDARRASAQLGPSMKALGLRHTPADVPQQQSCHALADAHAHNACEQRLVAAARAAQALADTCARDGARIEVSQVREFKSLAIKQVKLNITSINVNFNSGQPLPPRLPTSKFQLSRKEKNVLTRTRGALDSIIAGGLILHSVACRQAAARSAVETFILFPETWNLEVG